MVFRPHSIIEWFTELFFLFVRIGSCHFLPSAVDSRGHFRVVEIPQVKNRSFINQILAGEMIVTLTRIIRKHRSIYS